MVDVLATGPKSWMESPMHLSLSPSHISACSPYFHEISERLEKQALTPPSDWYSLLPPSTTETHPSCLQYPSPPFETPGQHRKPSGNMLSQQNLSKQHALNGSREDPIESTLRLDSQHPTLYHQSISPFLARPDFNVALSSNGSTYCESDLESLEPFEDTFAPHPADTKCSPMHPIPKGSAYTSGSNISYLSGSDETTSLLSDKIQDTSLNGPVFPGQPYQVSNKGDPNMGGRLGRIHNKQHLAFPDFLGGKPPTYDDTTSWSTCVTSVPNYAWGSGRDLSDATFESSWHNPNAHNVFPNYQYAQQEGVYGHPIQLNEFSNGISRIPSGHSSAALASPPYLTYQACQTNPAPQLVSRQAHPSPYPPTQPTYVSSPHDLHSDVENCPPLQKLPLPGSLSPSALTPSTIEEGPSPRQTAGEQSGIETKIHYGDERNTFLIDCKRRGLSYKDIKRVGGFKEAESTLRGRYRTLTKSKDQRVRKPKWQDKDVSLSYTQGWTLHAQ